ncbi:protein FAM183A [Latimeria chalumnae]|uniref:Cilia and flagella associated protein 144 n=1 Tax=Latimeria chalumnae TaxID=7897 RepID=H3A7Q3_LATCH|nr:PREDICTED: protein FAM183A [Latimeria chalumnae]|eukprot:XP_006012440.1 PREDICTED: protein FAM183A [Latimeria chalumnae]
MAAKGAGKEKETMDLVHEYAIMCETVKKELRNQRLCTTYSINPFRKLHSVTGKPMSRHDCVSEEGDATFLEIIHRAALEPTQKYTKPQTESQEIGWISKPLITLDRNDRRFFFPRVNSELTVYMDMAWRLKEAEKQSQKQA